MNNVTSSLDIEIGAGSLDDDSPKDECGVLGISTPHGEGVAQLAFFGLFALQHRGQEAAGIAVSDGQRARVHKDAGLVSTVFTPEALAPLAGYHAIGHTRYSTTGSSSLRNIQPFLVETMHGTLAVAHNGNRRLFARAAAVVRAHGHRCVCRSERRRSRASRTGARNNPRSASGSPTR
jgi:glutamine phosphoribosylpyrophosphate amidotransferase